MTATATRRKCEAIIRRDASEYGFVQVSCGQTVGVRTIVDYQGDERGFCPREGHQANVIRRFGLVTDRTP